MHSIDRFTNVFRALYINGITVYTYCADRNWKQYDGTVETNNRKNVELSKRRWPETNKIAEIVNLSKTSVHRILTLTNEHKMSRVCKCLVYNLAVKYKISIIKNEYRYWRQRLRWAAPGHLHPCLTKCL